MTKKAYFEQMNRRGFVNSKPFWNTVKLFLTNKGFFPSENIKKTKENLFNIFLIDLLALLKKSQLYNFADDNTVSAEANSTDDLLSLKRRISCKMIQRKQFDSKS